MFLDIFCRPFFSVLQISIVDIIKIDFRATAGMKVIQIDVYSLYEMLKKKPRKNMLRQVFLSQK